MGYLKKKFLPWFQALTAAFIQGAATSVAAIQLDSGQTFSLLSEWNTTMVLKLAVISGSIGAALYLMRSPLPTYEESDKET
jgi:hypothetical protein